jgi:hypothetical protein
MTDTTRLEAEFEAATWDAIEECKRFGYNPTIWISMVRQQGPAQAARQLLESGDIQPGLERLVREGRLDLTIEMAVLHPRWDSLFGRGHREAAHWRLTQAMRA